MKSTKEQKTEDEMALKRSILILKRMPTEKATKLCKAFLAALKKGGGVK